MTTTVHGPGDRSPQADETQVTNMIEADEAEHAARQEAGEWPYGEEPEAVVSEALFDPAPFKTSTPVFDNLASDKLVISLGGPIELDPTDPEDIALFENFMRGRSVNLQVHGSVVGKAGTYKEDADGAVTVTGKAAVKIHSLTLQGK